MKPNRLESFPLKKLHMVHPTLLHLGSVSRFKSSYTQFSCTPFASKNFDLTKEFVNGFQMIWFFWNLKSIVFVRPDTYQIYLAGVNQKAELFQSIHIDSICMDNPTMKNT